MLLLGVSDGEDISHKSFINYYTFYGFNTISKVSEFFTIIASIFRTIFDKNEPKL
jgi:hypothetical protein